MRDVAYGLFAVAVFAGCDGPDEVICELTLNDVEICIDPGVSMKYCEKTWGGVGSDAELEPGGPYAYCEDLYAVQCPGTVHEIGENFTAELPYYAESDEDCDAAEGATIGG